MVGDRPSRLDCRIGLQDDVAWAGSGHERFGGVFRYPPLDSKPWFSDVGPTLSAKPSYAGTGQDNATQAIPSRPCLPLRPAVGNDRLYRRGCDVFDGGNAPVPTDQGVRSFGRATRQIGRSLRCSSASRTGSNSRQPALKSLTIFAPHLLHGAR